MNTQIVSKSSQEIIADAWYRFDAGDGHASQADPVRVRQAAADAFTHPNHAIASGRFRTSFAIYTRGEQMTDAERAALAAMLKERAQ
jgi:hypothetical protein